MAGLSFLGLTLWFLGYPDQALRTTRAAVELAQRMAHPPSLALSLFAVGWLHQLRHDVHAAHAAAARSLQLCRDKGFRFWLTLAQGLQSWVLAQQEGGDGELRQLQEQLSDFGQTGATLSSVYWMALLADLCRTLGRHAEGLELLSRAIPLAHASGEQFFEAELWRLEGELLAHDPTPPLPAIEERLRGALAIAARQEAKSLELRILLSAHRRLPPQPEHADLRQRLAECAAWFQEGLDTPDVRAAQALVSGPR